MIVTRQKHVYSIRRDAPLQQIIRQISRFLILFLVFVSCVLPSGSLYGLNYKLPVVALCAISLILYTGVNKSISRLSTGLLAISSIFLGTLIYWVILGLSYGYMQAAEQYQGFLVTVLYVNIVVIALAEKVVQFQTVKRVVVYAFFLYGFIKITLVVLIYFQIIGFPQLLGYFNIFSYSPVTQLITSGIIRIQTINDIIAPFSLFILLDRRTNFKHRVFIILIWLLTVFICYSRFVWFISALPFILNSLKTAKNSVMTSIFFVVISSIIFATGVASSSNTVLYDRFSSGGVVESDNIRNQQIKSLLVGFDRDPLLGNGLGSYTSVIRDPENKFNYEVQFLALLMQTGFVGISIISAVLLLICIMIFRANHLIGVLYIAWISASFTNPYLVSSVSGIIFAYFIAESKFLPNRAGAAVRKVHV